MPSEGRLAEDRLAEGRSAEGAVLGFDTSGGWIAAAVIRGGVVLTHRHVALAKGQGEALLAQLDAVLAEAGLGWGDLAAIGAGTGPGNFTGIRITIAAARGLALGLGIPAIGVSRFEALALDGPALPVVVEALRGQVWLHEPGGAPVLSETAPEAVIDAQSAAHPLAVAIARIADARRHQPQPRPAPLYLRAADAAPSADRPPRMIDG